LSRTGLPIEPLPDLPVLALTWGRALWDHTRMNARAFNLLGAFVLLCTGLHARAETPLAAAPEAVADAGPCDPDAGTCPQMTVKQLFESKCATCHGPDGKGKTKYGKKHDIPNFATKKWQKEIDDAEIGQKIRDGVIDHGKRVMPAFKAKLQPDQIATLTLYLRGLKP
jgi:mono/diheme cytochrome c family protein